MTDRQLVPSGTRYEPIYGYSRAVRVGSHIYVSGTIAWGDDGEIVGEGDMYRQAKQAIANIARALEHAGATLANVVRTRAFVTDISRFDEVARAHGEAFGKILPAATLVEVTRMVDDAVLIEIEADAVL